MKSITRIGSDYFQWKPLFSVEVICFIRSYVRFSGKCSFQSKLFLSVEAIIFSGNHWPIVVFNSFSGNCSFKWKTILSLEAIPFIGSHPFQWKSFFLVDTISGSGSHSFQGKPLFFVEIVAPFFQWKLLLLIETFPFSGSHSFQCFNICLGRSYHQLRELLNINDSVRLLQMANLPCIHIPVEVFLSSGGVFRTLANIWDKTLLSL